MAHKHVSDSAKAVRDMIKKMIDVHVPRNLLGVVTNVSPIVVDIAGMDSDLAEDENLLISHVVRKYDQDHGLVEGDTLLLVPAHGGDYVATAVVTENASLGGVTGSEDNLTRGAGMSLPGSLVAGSAHVTVAGTTYTVTGGTVTVPVTASTTHFDSEGNAVGEVPIL